MSNQPNHCTEAKVVYEKPLSGRFDEVLFGSALGNTLWVHFSDLLGDVEWIGKFDCGSFGGNKVTKAVEPDTFFVCAGGWTYFLDATNRKLLEEPYKGPHVHDAVFDPKRQAVIVADWSTISLVRAGKILWSQRIATDGIRDLRIDGDVLFGLGEFDYDGSETVFALDLETKKLRLGKSVAKAGISRGNRPWWKIW